MCPARHRPSRQKRTRGQGTDDDGLSTLEAARPHAGPWPCTKTVRPFSRLSSCGAVPRGGTARAWAPRRHPHLSHHAATRIFHTANDTLGCRARLHSRCAPLRALAAGHLGWRARPLPRRASAALTCFCSWVVKHSLVRSPASPQCPALSRPDRRLRNTVRLAPRQQADRVGARPSSRRSPPPGRTLRRLTSAALARRHRV